MSTDRLIEHRNATLDIFRRLKEARINAGKNIPDTIAKSQKNLEDSRFLLAIIGKVSVGKSTFINALLTEDLLPTDALQATAAIIEIFHREQPFLRITYANGRIEELSAEHGTIQITQLSEKLKQVAAVRPEERDLPVAQLNDFIIERYDSEKRMADWDTSMIDAFIDVDLPRILRESPGSWQQLSRAYLEHHRDGNNVAKCVEVGYPSAYHFGHFRIVDTPGICAKGGFAERTRDFLNKADAVIYLHKEEPNENSLHDSLENFIPEKTKKHILLVLTHKCDRGDKENEDFLNETIRRCPQIEPDRIFLVDSLTDRALQTFYDLKTWDEIAEVRRRDTKTHKAWKRVTAEVFEDADHQRAVLLELLEKQSNMKNLKKAILRMSEKSLGIQIATVLSAIVELYGELETDAAARRDLIGEKLKDPQHFAAEMTRQKQLIDELEAESAKRVREIEKKYNLDNTRQKFGGELQEIIKRAETEINGKEFRSDDTAKTADDYLTKIKQDVDNDLEELVKTIKEAFNGDISEMETSMQLSFDITVPKIPITEILEKVREESTETKTRTKEKDGFWNGVKRFFGNQSGWSTEEYKSLNAEKYFSNAQTRFIQELWIKKTELAKSVKTLIDQACTFYQKSVREKLDFRRAMIGKLEKDQRDNAEVQRQFENEAQQVESAKQEIAECEKIRGDIA